MYEEESEELTSSLDSVSSTTSLYSNYGRCCFRCNHNGTVVLLIEFFERLNYYSVIANLILFCHAKLKINAVDSTCFVLLFIGLSYIFPLFGVWLADSIVGRFNVLYASCLLYLAGTSLILVVASDLPLRCTERYVCFAVGLLLASIGNGGMKSNISSFGIDQVAINGNVAIRQFFTWFYCLINLATFVSFTFVAYLQTQNFFYGYIVSTSSIFLALCFLFSGRRSFVCKPADGNYLTDFIKIVAHAFHRHRYKSSLLCDLPKGAGLDFLDYAHVIYGGKYTTGQIDVVRCICRVLLVLSTTIIFWMIYFQMPTSFLIQGQSLRLHMWLNIKLPAASMNLFDCVFVLLINQCVEPISKLVSRRVRITSLRRMGFGMILASLAMYFAGLTEEHRRNRVSGDFLNMIGDKAYNASRLSIFSQVPQYALIGASEAFTSISCLEFAYSQTPRFLQSVVLGFFLLMSGIGALVGSVYVKVLSIYTNWYCFQPNQCRMEYYFYSLSAIMGVNFFVFLLVSRKFTYVENYLAGVSTSSLPRGRNEAGITRDEIKSPAFSQGHM